MLNIFNLTDQYPIYKLSELVTFLDNQRKPVKAIDRIEGDYPYYGANGQQGTINDYIFDETLILLAEDGGHFADSKRPIAYIAEGKYWVNNHAHVLRPNTGVELRYLYWILAFYNVMPFIKGATRAKLSKTDASKIPIPLPPIKTQKRIVSLLDRAQALIDKRKEQIALMDQLIQSIFYDMFSQSKFNNIAMTEIVLDSKKSIRSGPFGSALKHSEFTSEGIAVLGIDNAVNNSFEWRERRFISEKKFEQLKRYTVFPDDVIITIMGTTGRVAVVPKNIPTAITTKHLAAITLNKKVLLPYYFSFCIRFHPVVIDQLNSKKKGAIMDGLNLGIIKGLKIPVPPLILQNTFADRVKKIESQKQIMTTALKELENNFNSLMQRAFKGEI